MWFTKLMEQYKGKITTVKATHYNIAEDSGFWAWTDEMLELVEEREKNNMNIEELNLEYKNKMDKLLEEYKDKIKEVTEVKEEPFIKKGQKYFTIDNWFRILATKNYDCEDDAERIQIGDCYPFTDETKEEVCKEVNLIAERRKLQSEMEMFARQNNEEEIDWNNSEQVKWYLYLIYEENEIREGWTWDMRHFNTVYFTSAEVAEKALEKFGDRIRELYIDSEE